MPAFFFRRLMGPVELKIIWPIHFRADFFARPYFRMGSENFR